MDILELREWLERHHHESYGWALLCCSRDRERAEDVLQTVYLKVLEGKARYAGKAAFKTWLFSVIRKTAAEERRRSFLSGLRLLRYTEKVQSAAQEDPVEESVFRAQVRSAFLQAFATLSRRQREVLQLVFYHDLTVEAAAEVLEISVGSARTHYDRGKRRLRERMEASHVLDEGRSARKGNLGALPRPPAGG